MSPGTENQRPSILGEHAPLPNLVAWLEPRFPFGSREAKPSVLNGSVLRVDPKRETTFRSIGLDFACVLP
jgi:hypothetical protein